MKKSYLMMAAMTAMLLTACSQSEEIVQTERPSAPTAIEFGTYLGRTTTTRATYGTIDAQALQASTDGFGVLAYYTEDKQWPNASEGNTQADGGESTEDGNASESTTTANTFTPNFMYNEQVTYNDSKWTYSPVKYWPNEAYSTPADGTYTGEGNGRPYISFFAYAPHAGEAKQDETATNNAKFQVKGEGTTAASNATVGITELTGNKKTGAPAVKFVQPQAPKEQIDLLYANATNRTKLNMQTNNDGTVTQAVKFEFKHALALLSLQDFTIQAVVDDTEVKTEGATNLDGSTKIYINSVTISADDKLATSGTLSLEDGTWSALGYPTEDNKTTTFGIGTINPELQAPKEEQTSTEDDEETTDDEKASPNGVTTKAQNLFKQNSDNDKTNECLMVIPTSTDENTTNPTITVVIDYNVITTDPKVSGGKVTVNNKIKNSTQFKLDQGKKYKFALLIGMTSVKLDAEVSETGWTNADDSQNIWLPVNISDTSSSSGGEDNGESSSNGDSNESSNGEGGN